MGNETLILLGVGALVIIVFGKQIMEAITGFTLAAAWPKMDAENRATAKSELQSIYGKSNYVRSRY